MATIQTTNGYAVLIDDADFDLVSSYRWRVMRDGYASCRIRQGKTQRTLYMHRLLCGLDFGDSRYVDHKNLTRLDNRRQNLRVCTALENVHNTSLRKSNTSGYKGVTFDKRRGTWVARVRCNGTRHHMTGFVSAKDAHTALCLLREELHGAFANHGEKSL